MEDFDYLSQNKIFCHLDRISEWLKKGITKPVMLEIDPTNICNHNCPKCAGNRSSPQVYLSLKFMKNLIRQTSHFLKSIVFTGGGEPLMNKDTVGAVLFAKKNNLDVGFITNGTLINEDIANELIKNCKWIRISLDANNSKDYSLVHGIKPTFYEQTLHNINLLVKLKKQNTSSCTIGVGYLTNKKSSEHMFNFTKKMKDIGVDYVQFRPFHFDRFDVSKEIKKCTKLESSSFKVIVSQHRYDKIEYSYPISYRDEFTTIVAADGKLYPGCFTRGMKEFELGDLNKSSFNEIWNSKRRRKIFENKLKMNGCPIMCKYDKLSQTLWEILKINKYGKHINFI